MIVGFSYCPPGWAEAAGQILPISRYQALYALLGTAFGGDGRTGFSLPDLRGRATIGQGSGPGQPNDTWGQKSGSETQVMIANAGGNQPTEVLDASLVIRYCIALVGVYPSRN